MPSTSVVLKHFHAKDPQIDMYSKIEIMKQKTNYLKLNQKISKVDVQARSASRK